jgi:hypothetical protein
VSFFIGSFFAMLLLGLPYLVIESRGHHRAIARERRLLEDSLQAEGVKQDFDPDRAVLVRNIEQIESEANISVQTQRIYRSFRGEYFLFICTSGESGLLSRITRERAMEALRSTPELLSKEFPEVA